MPKFIVYLDNIAASGSVGPDLSFKIKVGSNPVVSVGGSPKKKTITKPADIPNSKSISVTIDAVEKDLISDFGQATSPLSLFLFTILAVETFLDQSCLVP